MREASIRTATSSCVRGNRLVVVRPVEPRRRVEARAERLEDRGDRRPLPAVELGVPLNIRCSSRCVAPV